MISCRVLIAHLAAAREAGARAGAALLTAVLASDAGIGYEPDC
jgi:hypothetical protein